MPEVMRAHFVRCEAALSRLRAAVIQARPDACVVLGASQQEMYPSGTMPMFSVYSGDRFLCQAPDSSQWPLASRMAAWGYFGDEPYFYPCHTGLARHLLDRLRDAGQQAECVQPIPGVGMGRAYTFLYRRELCPPQLPMVPVFINTYYPPSQPSVDRVLAFGSALRAALDSYPGKVRIAVFVSGGLSHFLVNEPLDRALLAALCSGEPGKLEKVPEASFKSGTSEIKNWLAMGSAMAPGNMTLLDYIPGYRSKAGTGCGLAFGLWERRLSR